MRTIASLKKVVKNNSFLNALWQNVVCRIIFKVNPKILANWTYKSRFNKNIDWDNPKDLIEKIYWLLFNTDTSLWTTCADKYLVREYVKSKGLEESLNTIYGVYSDVEDIDWNSLPQSFVLKWNNGSGQVLLVKDKSKLNLPATKKTLNQWLKSSYGFEGAQLHYLKIKSCIIAEEYLVNAVDPNKSLVDYKIWCFHGQPKFVLVVYDRNGEDYKLSAYDMDWNNISTDVFDKLNPHYGGDNIPKPTSFVRMIEMSTILSSDFIEVRCDFYEINKKPIFGELTFTTGYGYFSKEYYLKLGECIDLKIEDN